MWKSDRGTNFRSPLDSYQYSKKQYFDIFCSLLLDKLMQPLLIQKASKILKLQLNESVIDNDSLCYGTALVRGSLLLSSVKLTFLGEFPGYEPEFITGKLIQSSIFRILGHEKDRFTGKLIQICMGFPEKRSSKRSLYSNFE